MKDRTRDAARMLKIVAGIILFFGIVAATVLIMIGIMTIVSENDRVAMAILKTTGPLLIFYGFIVAFGHLAIYALLNGFSVIVENSDRTVIENALFEIADMRGNMEDHVPPEDDRED